MKRIKGVEVFAVGKWNNRKFTLADLDGMVEAFEDLELAGRLPVKLGHDTHDNEPAQGWITELSRSGEKLLATFDQVPDKLVDDIKAGRFRHVSIELLGDVTHQGRQYKWVPDGVAVLGAARPAVKSLRGLHELVASALPGLAFRERLAFAMKPKAKDDDDDENADVLRAENALLKQEVIVSKFDAAISAGRILPADRERFFRRYGTEGTLEEAVRWIKDSPKPDRSHFSQGGAGAGRVDPEQGATVTGSADEELVRLTIELVEERAKEKRPISYIEASRIVFKRNKALVQRYHDERGTR